MDLRSVMVLQSKELGDAWRNRWFVLYALTFVGLALAMSWVSVLGVMGSGFAGLGRTAASLINLVVLIVPLMGLSLGAVSIAGDRESGLLLYTLAQPVGLAEIVVAKFCGLAVALLAALLVGFGGAALAISGAVTASQGAEIGSFVAFLALSTLVALAAASLGLCISALCTGASTAGGVALFVWLVLVLLGDLGLMGTALVMEMSPGTLLTAALVNPLQVFKLATVVAIRGGAEVLGPAGLYATQRLGEWLMPTLVGILALWVVVPLAVALLVLRRRGVLA